MALRQVSGARYGPKTGLWSQIELRDRSQMPDVARDRSQRPDVAQRQVSGVKVSLREA